MISCITVVQWMGGLLAFIALGIVFLGIWRGTQRQAGRSAGRASSWLRSWVFYLTASAFFFGIAWLGWLPLPLSPSPPVRYAMLALGSFLYFPGLFLLLWSRLALGKNYFVSTSLGVQLFANHQLVTTGPYAILRHPMYAGLMLAALGSLLIYTTWTSLYFACFAPLLALRARREEQALAAEFGPHWQEYCRRTPAFFPRLGKKR